MKEMIFTHDNATALFREDTDGVSVNDGNVTIEWDKLERKTVKDPVVAEYFGTTDFYVLPATVARPIKQTYQYGDSHLTFIKPRDELKKAAWSLDGKPWTLEHPDTTVIKDSKDIQGFWKNPRYIDAIDSLDADLHIPVNNDEGMKYIEQYGDVSVGFYNRVARVDSYDGNVGQVDSLSGVDGFQTDMYFDHVASVPIGRCSSEQGCGVNVGTMRPLGDSDEGYLKGTDITHTNRGDMNGLFADAGISVHTPEFSDTREAPWNEPSLEDFSDMSWDEMSSEEKSDISAHFLVSKTGFPPENFGDLSLPIVDSEGNLVLNALQNAKARAGQVSGLSGDALSQVENTIDRLANDNFSDADFGENNDGQKITMTDANTDCGGQGLEIQMDDLSVDAIAAKHDGVREALDAKEEKIEELEKQAESAADAKALAEEKVEELQAKVDEFESEEKQKLVDEIVERTEVLGDADDLMELSLDEVQDKHKLVLELGATEKTAPAGAADEGENTEVKPAFQRSSPWD